jgi:hypothetical protein
MLECLQSETQLASEFCRLVSDSELEYQVFASKLGITIAHVCMYAECACVRYSKISRFT